MFQRFKTKIFLMVLPSVDTILNGVHSALLQLDRITTTLDKRLEDEAVRLGQLSQQRRDAIASVQQVYDRKDAVAVDNVNLIRQRAAQAAEARDRVAAVLS